MANKSAQIRRGYHAAWVANNPVLLDGELGLEKDTYRLKFGNGVDGWNDLHYVGEPVCFGRVPLATDNIYPLMQYWINTNDDAIYYLKKYNGINAVWENLASTSGINTYTYTQSVPSGNWNIQHDLNLLVFPIGVLTLDAIGERIVGFVDYVSSTANILVIRFCEPVAGTAIFNY